MEGRKITLFIAMFVIGAILVVGGVYEILAGKDKRLRSTFVVTTLVGVVVAAYSAAKCYGVL